MGKLDLITSADLTVFGVPVGSKLNYYKIYFYIFAVTLITMTGPPSITDISFLLLIMHTCPVLSHYIIPCICDLLCLN